MKIFINNRERHISEERLTYSQVVIYGLYDLPAYDRIVPTVSYRYAGQSVSETLQPRSSIRLAEGMHFSVINGKRIEKEKQMAASIQNAASKMIEIVEAAVESNKPKALNHSFLDKAPLELLRWPSTMTPEEIDAEKERVRLLMKPYEDKYQTRQLANHPELAAKLKDALIIINLQYEEAVTAGLRTPGRRIAGTFLHSNGYAEVVKHLENQ